MKRTLTFLFFSLLLVCSSCKKDNIPPSDAQAAGASLKAALASVSLSSVSVLKYDQSLLLAFGKSISISNDGIATILDDNGKPTMNFNMAKMVGYKISGDILLLYF